MASGEIALRLAVGAGAGLAAAVVMDWPMSRQPEGFTPAYIAASVLSRSDPAATSFSAAAFAHHGAGVFAGLLYAIVGWTLGLVFPQAFVVGGINVLTHVFAVAFVVGFIYLFFSRLVLPRAGGRIYEEQATAVRGQWLRSALVFGSVMLVLPIAVFLTI